MTEVDQLTVRCVLARGGASKGLYFHEHNLPPAGRRRDALLLRLMGSPDVLQIDGLGGSRPVTSKVAIIRPSRREDADVEYTFAQVDLTRPLVDYVGNCGNLSAGVGPFAVDEGLVEVLEPITRVRIHNTNTNKILVADVPVVGATRTGRRPTRRTTSRKEDSVARSTSRCRTAPRRATPRTTRTPPSIPPRGAARTTSTNS